MEPIEIATDLKPHPLPRLVTPGQQLEAAVRGKDRYAAERAALSFEEKLRILVKLQEKAFAMGRTKVRPWPIQSSVDRA